MNENVRSLHGRTIQNMNQIYTLPTDEPEIERLDRQHRMLSLAIGTLCWPMEDVRQALTPRGSPVHILDIGSGSGRWAVEMAKEFPHAKVLGIDLAPKRPTDMPENCRFEVLDVLNQDVSHLHGVYDVVHCRALGGGMHKYQSFLELAAGMVKPGGLLLDVGPENLVYDEAKQPIKPAFTNQDVEGGSWLARLLFESTNRMRLVDGVLTTGFGPTVQKWLSESPHLENVKHRGFFIPIGWRGSDDVELANREEAGQILLTNLLELAQAFRPGLLAAGMEAEELDTCIRENEKDLLQLRVKNYVLWNFCVARVK